MLTALYNSPPSVNPIPALSPAAWFRGGYGVTGTLTASNWADQSGNGRDLAQGTAGNQPIVLPYSGTPYAYLPGVASNTLTSPNKSVTGSQTLTLDLALNDYTPAADVTLVDKTSGNDGFAIKWLTTDKLRFIVGDGVALTNCDASVASGLTDASRHTVVIAWTDGVGASLTIDGVAWGSAIVAAKTLTNAAVAVTVGSATSIGKLYSFGVNGIYGLNPSDFAETSTNGATAVSSTTGETWTLNSSGAKPSQVVKSANLLTDQLRYMATGAFTLTGATTTYVVCKSNVWAASTYLLDGITTNSLGLGEFAGSTPDLGFVGPIANNGGLAIGTKGIVTAVENGASSSITINAGTPVTGNHATGAKGGLTFNTFGGGTTGANNGQWQVWEIIIFSAAHTAAQRASVQQWLNSVHHVY